MRNLATISSQITRLTCYISDMHRLFTPMRLFVFATLTPVALIGIGAINGGLWIVLALIFLTAMTNLLDRLIPHVIPAKDTEFPAGDGLSVALALSHFALMIVVVNALAGAALGLWEKAGLFIAAGLFFGQISNANAHELIHRTSRRLHDLGMWVYISLLFGHHTSAHVLVHHRYVATAADPNTSRKGENLYRYAVRAWRGSLREGYRAEAARLAKINRSRWHNPYLIYGGGAVAMLIIAYVIGGISGLIAYIGLAGFAQIQLLMSDYVQHYGLTRAIGDNGKPTPVAARHSWNSPHWFSSALMLNATRHSDHHANPARPYPALTLPDDGPLLPKPLPLMAGMALYPPLWYQIMDPLVEKYSDA